MGEETKGQQKEKENERSNGEGKRGKELKLYKILRGRITWHIREM